MGYSTQFDGMLKFNPELTASQLAKVSAFLGEDCRDHPEWDRPGKPYSGHTYIDLELTDDFSGLKWDGSEKTYELPEKINMMIDLLNEDFEFGLEGAMRAQGGDIGDVWLLVMENNEAKVKEAVYHTGAKLEKIDLEELWEEFSEQLGTDIDDLHYYAGKTILLKEDFLKLMEKFNDAS